MTNRKEEVVIQALFGDDLQFARSQEFRQSGFHEEHREGLADTRSRPAAEGEEVVATDGVPRGIAIGPSIWPIL